MTREDVVTALGDALAQNAIPPLQNDVGVAKGACGGCYMKESSALT